MNLTNLITAREREHERKREREREMYLTLHFYNDGHNKEILPKGTRLPVRTVWMMSSDFTKGFREPGKQTNTSQP